MSMVIESGTPVNLTASGVISPNPGALLGFFVNSTTAGTVVIRNGGASGTALGGAITPAAGAFYRYPAACNVGMYATITGTLDVTFFFQPA